MKKELLKGVALGAVSTCLVLGVAYSSADADRSIMVEEGIRMELNQIPFVPRDSNGNAVSPFVYNGTTYVPMRPLCEAIGLNVSYNSATNTASITTSGNDSSNTAYITTEKAKEIALDTSGVSALEAKFTKCNLKLQDGKMVYDVSLTSGTKVYNYVIDARTGKILSSNTDGQTELYITREKAKEIALDTAGVSALDAKFTKADLTDQNGTKVYAVSFTSGTKVYNYVIDAKTGKILSSDIDHHSSKPGNTNTSGYISQEKAKEIAVSKAGVSNPQKMSCELDKDDGRAVYEVKFKSGSTEYEYKIDAKTGNILSSDVDRDDD